MPMRLRNGRILEDKIPIKRARLGKKPKTNWFDLPFEMREMIIDEMDAKTKFTLARCSKLCEKEVKESKHYVHSITIHWGSGVEALCLQYGKERCEENLLTITFDQLEKDKTLVTFGRGEYKVVYSESLAKIENGPPIVVQANYVNEYVEKHKNSIRALEFEDNRWRDENVISLDFNNLKKLKDVIIRSWCRDIELSSVHQFIDLNKLYHMDAVCMMDTRLEFEQILKFQGADVVLRSKYFREQEILQYLNMWRNEEMHENVRKRRIYFDEIANFRRIAQAFEGVYNFQHRRASIIEYIFDCKSKYNRTFRVETDCGDQILIIEWI